MYGKSVIVLSPSERPCSSYGLGKSLERSEAIFARNQRLLRRLLLLLSNKRFAPDRSLVVVRHSGPRVARPE